MRSTIILKLKTNACPNISRAVKYYSREKQGFKIRKITSVIKMTKTMIPLKKQGLYLE